MSQLGYINLLFKIQHDLCPILFIAQISITRNQLLDEVWGFDYFGDSRTVDVHVKRLREKLEGVCENWSLKTVWGVGYKFEVL